MLALVVATAVVGVRWWRDVHRSDLDRAMSLAPDDGDRFSWTDWAGVRDELGVDLSADSPQGEVVDFMAAGYDADLTSTSALPESAQQLHVHYGFSPATADWELFSQSEEGAVVMLHLPDSTDWDLIADRLRRLGYAEPDEADGVWAGGSEAIGRLGGVTPEVSFVTLLEDESLVLTSDTEGYLGSAVEVALGDAPSVEGFEEVVEASGEALSAALYTGAQACGALAMSQADADDQAEADRLLAQAGAVDPFTAYALSVQPGLDLRLALAFESDEQARANAESRAALAAGPSPGQGGDFSDRFELGPVEADGPLLTLDLDPVDGASVLSDLSTGPVLFATC
ncbi:hypothetical protein [Nocardioides sp. cx-173]|uniref:hypothetical protein n=1 Tax=Nocardioides sp. cx-173 TaxID=2898796 RepID=UPI001E4408E0|nr:hypothetical protein [Nocardioides sp. cx-173]MCD4526900.1 hypothetical protein [Nocardioides sp. cx-173]UGB41311.1 hypothetical protein LQ940_18315 [Nocardioides sp. cx-173]